MKISAYKHQVSVTINIIELNHLKEHIFAFQFFIDFTEWLLVLGY